MKKHLCCGVAITALPAQADQLLVQQNYDSPVFIASGLGASATGGDEATAVAGPWNAAGWAGAYNTSRTTDLSQASLSGLAPNSNVRLGSGIIAFLDSWDGMTGPASPDYLEVLINGNVVASLSVDNYFGGEKDYDGATELFHRVNAGGNPQYVDTLVDISTASFANSLADASGNWSFGFRAGGAGFQGSSDEGWGIDNWSIYGTLAPGAVPEPSTWAMMIIGFGAVGGAMRRRRAIPVRLSRA